MNKNESKYFNTALKMNDALISLLASKDFEYITIKDICEKAGVNRSTFYLHYSNTSDLLEEVIDRLNESFSRHFNTSKTDHSIISSKDLDDLYLITDEFLIPCLTFIKENRKVYKAVKSRPNLFNANKSYEWMFRSIFSPIMNRFGLELKWHRYLMDFYINGITAFVIDWVDDDCKIDVEEVSNFIKSLIVSYDKKDNK